MQSNLIRSNENTSIAYSINMRNSSEEEHHYHDIMPLYGQYLESGGSTTRIVCHPSSLSSSSSTKQVTSSSTISPDFLTNKHLVVTLGRNDMKTGVPNSSVLINSGITTSRTIGSSRSQHSASHPFLPKQPSFRDEDSRFKTNSHWKSLAVVFMVVSLLLLSCVIYLMTSSPTTSSTTSSTASECSCPAVKTQDSQDSLLVDSSSLVSQPSMSCPVVCNGRGSYVGGSCVCSQGWKGKECQVPVEDCEVANCSGHGYCRSGECLCDNGFIGRDCEMDLTSFCPVSSQVVEPKEEESSCPFQGYSHHSSPCSQDTQELKSSFNCSRCESHSHGRCQSNKSCICRPGFFGRYCSLIGCPNSCSGNGECTSDDEQEWSCSCRSGWIGHDCSQALELSCDDEIDNDNDGLIDCADSECCAHKHCQGHPLCFTSPDPLDILLRKQPPPPFASFFQRMLFLIEEDSVQSYAHKQAFNEKWVYMYIFFDYIGFLSLVSCLWFLVLGFLSLVSAFFSFSRFLSNIANKYLCSSLSCALFYALLNITSTSPNSFSSRFIARYAKMTLLSSLLWLCLQFYDHLSLEVQLISWNHDWWHFLWNGP